MAEDDRIELTDDELEEATGGRVTLLGFFQRKKKKGCPHYMAARFSFFPGCASCVYNRKGRCSHTSMSAKM